MQKLWSIASATLAIAISATTPSAAGDTATRCGEYGCDQIHCNDTGDHCTRYSDYDGYYNGYTNGYSNTYSNGYGDYGPSYGGSYYGPPENGYYGGYGPDEGGYGNGYYGGYEHLVCDSDGDRCYHSQEPYWNYREYYRIHGYHWDDGYRR